MKEIARLSAATLFGAAVAAAGISFGQQRHTVAPTPRCSDELTELLTIERKIDALEDKINRTDSAIEQQHEVLGRIDLTEAQTNGDLSKLILLLQVRR